MRFSAPATAVASVCLALPLAAQSSLSLVKDINTKKLVQSSFPFPSAYGKGRTAANRFVESGGKKFFVASTSATGTELFVTDGTPAGTKLVKDIRPGSSSSSVGQIVSLGGGKIAFRANDGKNGTEFWISDGTAAGTVMPKDIRPGVSSSFPAYLCPLGGRVYFAASDGVKGTELWCSDGTKAGTVLLKDIRSGSLSSSPRYLGPNPDGTGIYFSASNGTNGTELWKTDGTAAGTKMLKDIQTGSSSSSPIYFVNIGASGFGSGVTLFRAFKSGQGTELWKTDGTTAGTVLVKDIRSGSSSSSPNLFSGAVLGGSFYFYANNGTTGNELWKSDGTTAGTVLVKDIYPGPGSSTPVNMEPAGSVLYFSAFRSGSGGTGRELYKTDGTSAGTVLVKDLYPGPSSSSPSYITRVGTTGSTVIFSAFVGGTTGIGRELWISTGSTAGTVLVKDIWPGTSSSSPAYITPCGSGFLFRANDGVAGSELWFTDGGSAGTKLFKDLRGGNNTQASSPNYTCKLGKYTYFAATDGRTTGCHGTELWRTDGTTAGTTLVKDLYPGTSSSSPQYLARVGTQIVFSAFVGTSGKGRELYVTDGTAAGTKLLKDIRTGSFSSSPRFMSQAIRGKCYFQAFTSANGGELWVTDGTPAGTKLFKDIRPGSRSSSPQYFCELGNSGKFVFRAFSPTKGSEPYISDGTPAGTKMLKDIRSGSSSSFPSYFTRFKGGAIFSASNGTNGTEPWWTDGTAAGTKMIADIYTGSFRSSSPIYFTEVCGICYFSAFKSGTGGVGRELWRTDGTAAGTKLVKDIRAGTSSSSPSYLTNFGGRLFFRAFVSTSGKGTELYTSDGTAAGTKLYADIWPGQSSSSPFMVDEGYRFRYHVLCDATGAPKCMLFNADDGVKDNELWKRDNSGAMAYEFGLGCAQPGRIPHLSASAPILGGTQRGCISNYPSGTVFGALVWGSKDFSPFNFGHGCFSWVDTSKFWFVFANFLPGSSERTWTLSIPADNALNGLELAQQLWCLPTAYFTGFSVSNGVFTTFGK